ncbi:MAG TPA: UDP-N-acetylmuramoyl-L-alanine--D-glutamate ligase [Bryobacteraceae bacterium]|nr:UDP-N-acetylmuramoyl-L-alanine--D-glutamate ligase [Bryobacteraceae bacterium]
MQFSNKSVVVVGIKRSGMAAIELLIKEGARVRAMDMQLPSTEEQARLDALGVPFFSQTVESLFGVNRTPDFIVLSPGVPLDTPLFVEAARRGIPITGEVELASHFLEGPTIGITGSNGKTTTTGLTGHLLSAANIPNQVGGNIGTAVTSLVASSNEDQWNVLELSSFQLETVSSFEARIAACLNVTPDHLDRHGTLERYAAAKKRIFETQTNLDLAVLNYDDAICRQFAAVAKAEVYWFSSTQPVPLGVALENNQLLYCGEPFANRDQIKLRGIHNLENVMAASLIARLTGAPLDSLASAIHSFPGVEHRLEFVRELNGVQYFNDSKATNVDAALKAIAAFSQNLWIILGGKDKGSDYRPLREPLQASAKAVLLIGAAAPLINEALEGAVSMIHCETMPAAIHYSHAHAQPGDVVLLAPACASFDQYQNYEERGRHFKQLVSELF